MLLAGVLPGSPLAAQGPCPPPSGAAVTAGWSAYRRDSLDAAASRFTAALRLCPWNLDAQVGLGFAQLRLGRAASADTIFRKVLAHDARNADAWEGRARSAYRMGNAREAVAAGRRALGLNPRNDGLRSLLDRASPDWDRPPPGQPTRSATLQLVSRTQGERFEIHTKGGWAPFYVQGVNFGVALPGRFASEFPTDSSVYAGWLDTLATMRANTIRIYTILPPAFYRALRAWNLVHPDRTLWLIHGVWTELPPNDDFDDPTWKGEFRAEMRRIVNLIHGNGALPVRPGHASGRYDADVARWTLAYIIGREWEPFSVGAYDRQHPEPRPYQGRYLWVDDAAPAMDVWLAEQCDYLLAYEADRYNALRPIAYTNWPTLDPMRHPTEATLEEEKEWRDRRKVRATGRTYEYDNDAVGLNATLVHPTSSNPAGWFASYHAYPYYPDFINLDPGYAQTRSREGPSNYFGYLVDLKRHHPGIPLLIAEYGVPSSRGIAHLQPQGWHHGGHDEQAMAAIDARLTREIQESGAAGAIIFAWLDEWFKKNWVVIDLEIPPENTRRWHNLMDAEQNYGILGMHAGAAGAPPVPGGPSSRWLALPTLQRGDGTPGSPVLHVGSDASYLYLAVELTGYRGRPFPWDSLGLQIALDTYRRDLGQRRLPTSPVRSDIGFEFLVDLPSPSAGELRVVPGYSPYGGISRLTDAGDPGGFYARPVRTGARDDGRFDSLPVITNRPRFGRDGTLFPASGYNRGRLRYGTLQESTLSDWYYDQTAGVVELRLPWGLLNVTDPSSATLLFETAAGPTFGTVSSDGFRMGAVSYRKAGPARVLAAPSLAGARWLAQDFVSWELPTWREPTWHGRLKPVYDSLRILWSR